MQTQSIFKTFITSSLALFIISCNSSDKKNKTSDKPKDTAVADVQPPPPPAENPPGVEIIPATKKCFSNDGMKYSVAITINMWEKEASGNVTSEELGSGQKTTATFTATVSGDALTVTFKGTPPVVGDASEWTTKPWTIKNKAGKEKLHIVFNAKNYETNKWADADYEFETVACK